MRIYCHCQSLKQRVFNFIGYEKQLTPYKYFEKHIIYEEKQNRLSILSCGFYILIIFQLLRINVNNDNVSI